MGKVKEVQARATHLLQVWSQLQEMFRIPKRERHKIRVEHEREADRQDWHSDRNISNTTHAHSPHRQYSGGLRYFKL